MLRFDIPQVWSNVIRLEALVTTLVCVLALLVSPWLLGLLILQGAVRGFIGHHRCPSHWAFRALLIHFGSAGKKEDAGAKMFANKVLFFASSVSLGLYAAGSDLWVVPSIALIVFSTAEWALSFCAACWVYGAWYRRFPPTGA
ncbi:MAG: DUF4395 domain-containing protein [Comamonadaceae bacterium]|nr:DUF4395 domain-containing protein [Comamonadaceae bacterium]